MNYEIFSKKLKSGDIIDYAVQYYKENFKSFLLMTLFFHVPIILIASYLLDYNSLNSNLFTAAADPNADFPVAMVIKLYAGLFLLSVYESTIYFALILGVMKKTYNDIVFNEILSPKQSIKHGLKRFGWVLLFFFVASSIISIIYSIGSVVLMIIFTITGTLTESIPLIIIGVLLFFLVFIGGFVYLITKLIFVLPIIAIEGKDCFKAIKPSFAVSKKKFFGVFLTIMFGYLFTIQLPSLIQSVSLLITFNDIYVLKLLSVFASGFSAIITPIFPIIITFIYINYKVQNKKIDFEIKLRNLVKKESSQITFGRDVKVEFSKDVI